MWFVVSNSLRMNCSQVLSTLKICFNAREIHEERLWRERKKSGHLQELISHRGAKKGLWSFTIFVSSVENSSEWKLPNANEIPFSSIIGLAENVCVADNYKRCQKPLGISGKTCLIYLFVCVCVCMIWMNWPVKFASGYIIKKIPRFFDWGY